MTAHPGVDPEAIRALVREILADLLPAAAQDPGNPGGAAPAQAVPDWPAGAPGGPDAKAVDERILGLFPEIEALTTRRGLVWELVALERA